MSKVVIHQPDLMPWLGFFHKAMKAEVFVCLDHVKMDVKNCGWIKRVRIINNGNPSWLTIPTYSSQKRSYERIEEILIKKEDKLFMKTFRVIRENYQKSPFFNEVFPLIEQYYDHSSLKIADRNKDFIKSIFTKLRIKVKWIESRDLKIFTSKSEMNADITLSVKGTEYISGEGAIDYLNLKDFTDRNISLKINRFNPLKYEYKQFNTKQFVPGLSIIDVLMNCGFDGTLKLLGKVAKT